MPDPPNRPKRPEESEKFEELVPQQTRRGQRQRRGLKTRPRRQHKDDRESSGSSDDDDGAGGWGWGWSGSARRVSGRDFSRILEGHNPLSPGSGTSEKKAPAGWMEGGQREGVRSGRGEPDTGAGGQLAARSAPWGGHRVSQGTVT